MYNMSDNDKKPKKRGRKPKNKVIDLMSIKIDIKSEEEPLIAHLNIKLKDVVEEDGVSTIIEDNPINSESDSVFIKYEKDIKQQLISNSESDINNEVEKIENDMLKLRTKLLKLTKNNNIEMFKSKFSRDTKCWWCKNSFNTPAVGLPELYFENKFHCIGHFCSYNCALSYNIDINENIWNRTSLLNLLYHKTYNTNIAITAAPDWKQLNEYGGNLTIEDFRKNSIINNHSYTLLHPPIETRLHIFEKTLKTNHTSNITIYQKILEDSDDLVLKRSKPLKSSQYSLDKTLLIKKKPTNPY
jgi:hypothetical protein